MRISLKRGWFKELEEILGNIIRSRRVYLEKTYSYSQAGKLQTIRKYGQLLSEEYTEEGIKVTAYVPAELFAGLYGDGVGRKDDEKRLPQEEEDLCGGLFVDFG